MKQRAESGSLHARVASSVLPSVLMCKCVLCFLYTPGLREASKGLSADFTPLKHCSLQDVFFKLQQIEMAACKSVSCSLDLLVQHFDSNIWIGRMESLWNFVESFGGFHISYQLQLQIKIQIMLDWLTFNIGDPFTFRLSPSSGPKMCPVLYSMTEYL